MTPSKAMTRHGSREHFRQVVAAHVISPWSDYCRCGGRVGGGERGYRKHIADVWEPYALPDGWA